MRGERKRIKRGCKGGMLNGESKGGQELARYRQRKWKGSSGGEREE